MSVVRLNRRRRPALQWTMAKRFHRPAIDHNHMDKPVLEEAWLVSPGKAVQMAGGMDQAGETIERCGIVMVPPFIRNIWRRESGRKRNGLKAGASANDQAIQPLSLIHI